MSDREPVAASGDVDLATADARDVAADDRERLADDRDELADERAGLADLRDSLADQREHELMRCLGDGAGSAGGVAARSEMAQMAFALDRVRLAEAAIRRAELDRAQAQEALDRVVARRQRDHARQERDDALGARWARWALAVWKSGRGRSSGGISSRSNVSRPPMPGTRSPMAVTRPQTNGRTRRTRATGYCGVGKRRFDGRVMVAACVRRRCRPLGSILGLSVAWLSSADQRGSGLRVVGSRPAAPQPSGTGPAENGSLLTASFAALAQELITDSALGAGVAAPADV